MIDAGAVVRGVCVWDGLTPWNPPPGTASVVELQPGEACGPEWSYHPGQSPRFRKPEEES